MDEEDDENEERKQSELENELKDMEHNEQNEKDMKNEETEKEVTRSIDEIPERRIDDSSRDLTSPISLSLCRAGSQLLDKEDQRHNDPQQALFRHNRRINVVEAWPFHQQILLCSISSRCSPNRKL